MTPHPSRLLDDLFGILADRCDPEHVRLLVRSLAKWGGWLDDFAERDLRRCCALSLAFAYLGWRRSGQIQGAPVERRLLRRLVAAGWPPDPDAFATGDLAELRYRWGSLILTTTLQVYLRRPLLPDEPLAVDFALAQGGGIDAVLAEWGRVYEVAA